MMQIQPPAQEAESGLKQIWEELKQTREAESYVGFLLILLYGQRCILSSSQLHFP